MPHELQATVISRMEDGERKIGLFLTKEELGALRDAYRDNPEYNETLYRVSGDIDAALIAHGEDGDHSVLKVTPAKPDEELVIVVGKELEEATLILSEEEARATVQALEHNASSRAVDVLLLSQLRNILD